MDARAWGWTGVGRYTRNLLRELTALSHEHEYHVLVPPRFAPAVADLPGVRAVPVRDSYYSAYEQLGLWRILRRLSVDLMHFPHFNVPVLYRRPFVVTIHDLTRFHFEGQRHRSWLHQRAYELVFRSAVRQARTVIAVSAFTKAELLRRFPEAHGKTVVVYEGVEEQHFAPGERGEDVLRRLGVWTPYLLYVGLWMRHKNLPGLIAAFRRIRQAGYQGKLVVTGEGRPWDENVRGLARAAGVERDVHLPGSVTDPDLAVLYRRADCFLFPSFVEGFGLAPLEALACGTPVVAARTGSLPEILGSAALYADPNDPRSFADAVALVLKDSMLRSWLRLAGPLQAQRYRWRACAAATLAVYARARARSGTLPHTGREPASHDVRSTNTSAEEFAPQVPHALPGAGERRTAVGNPRR